MSKMSEEISGIEVKKVKKVTKKKKVTIEESSNLIDGVRRDSEVEIVEVTQLDNEGQNSTTTTTTTTEVFSSNYVHSL